MHLDMLSLHPIAAAFASHTLSVGRVACWVHVFVLEQNGQDQQKTLEYEFLTLGKNATVLYLGIRH